MLFKINIFFLVLFNLALGQSTDWLKVHNLTEEGIQKLYGLKIYSAIDDFEEVIKLAPGDPRGYFFKAMSYYHRYFLIGEKEDMEKFIYTAALVENICKDYLEDHDDAKYLFYLGGIKGYRAIIKTLYTDGPPSLGILKEGKDAYFLMKKAVELNPENYDSYMGLGIFTYMVGSIPKGFRWIAGILGFEGDKELGKKYLRLAYEKGLYTKYEAQWWLSFIYMGESNDEMALKHLETVVAKFPQNNLNLFLIGNFHYGLGNIEKAIDYYKKSEIVYAPEMKKLSTFSSAGIGQCLYLQNKFSEAQIYFQKFLDTVPEKEDRYRNRDNVLYFFAMTFALQNNPEKAKEYFEKVKYNDLAKLRIKFQLTSLQREIILAYNFGYAVNSKEGITRLNKLANSSNSGDEKGLALYYIAEIYKSKREYSNSINFYRKVLEETTSIEDWLKPYAQYNIGQCYLKLNDKLSAKVELEKALIYKNYSNYKSLTRRIENALTNTK